MFSKRAIKKSERRAESRRRKTGKRELAKHVRRLARAPKKEDY